MSRPSPSLCAIRTLFRKLMADAELRIEPGSLRRLVQASREWDKVTKREFRRNLRAAALGSQKAAQASVLGPPPGGGRGSGTGLRAGLAAGVRTTIRSGRDTATGVKGEGVRVIASGSRLPDDKQAMVKAYMSKSWRHPVFGHRDRYVSQRGKDWFFRPMFAGQDRYRAAVVAAIKDAERHIANH